MKSLRLLVVEDEEVSRDYLCELLMEHPGLEVRSASDGAEALELMAGWRPDGVFLDIELPGMQGTEVMNLLPEPRPAVVFVTAYVDYALEAIQGGAVHYLLKPINRMGILQALARIPGRSESPECLRIPVRRKGVTRLLKPEDVDALVADLGDCEAWTSEGRVHLDGTLAQWDERLSGIGFLRVHRNALVRLEAVRELTAQGEIVFGSGRIPVSRRRLPELERALGLELPKGPGAL